MRHKILTILALLCLTATSAWADTETIGTYTWTYTVSSDEATITEVSPATGDIVIPSTLGGKTVTRIDAGAFDFCNITSVTIPASVTTIGIQAFYFSDLTTVAIGNGVTSIGKDAFKGCTKVTDVYCYADPTNLTWDEDGCDDFNYDNQNQYTQTKCHVFNKDAWSGFTNVNLAFDSFDDINAKTVDGVTANQDPENTSNYWCTYYNPVANVKINTANVEIYKAKIQFEEGQNGRAKNVALTEVTGNNVIRAGQAVMLKTNATGAESALSMELTSDAATGDYANNNLEGGKMVTYGFVAYTLSDGYDPNSTTSKKQLGFYKFTGASLDGSKAHLEIRSDLQPLSNQPARGFIGFDDEETTAIDSMDHEKWIMDNEAGAQWYSLDGRRLSGQPTKKGVYVRNGQKFIVK